jgi:hypothetical protein
MNYSFLQCSWFGWGSQVEPRDGTSWDWTNEDSSTLDMTFT